MRVVVLCEQFAYLSCFFLSNGCTSFGGTARHCSAVCFFLCHVPFLPRIISSRPPLLLRLGVT